LPGARRLPAAAVDVAKGVIRRYPGKLPVYRWRLAALRAYRLPALARFESAQVDAALASWGRRPVASVAVVIPTYRRPRQLVEALESVLAQTMPDLVAVVIDDGAGLPALPDDKRVHAYSLARNCGVAGVVRNVGIRASASKYLAFLDDDNVWSPNHLEVALAAHERGAQLTYSALERVLPDGTRRDVLSVPFDRRRMTEEGISDTNTIVVRRRSFVRFSRVPLRHGDFPLEDWVFVHRLSRKLRTEHIPICTARYLIHGDSFFTDWEASARQEARHASGDR
jgi:glycosyltransferase involved in cell wall biosynthesis